MTLAFFAAAFFEIAGCFAFWSYFRMGRPAWTLALGVMSLVLFALALTRVDAAFAGRAYAAYGGIYIAASLVWLRAVEGVRPGRWDLVGATICMVGALVIIFGRRAQCDRFAAATDACGLGSPGAAPSCCDITSQRRRRINRTPSIASNGVVP